MRERPILFTGPMVRAILEGRKTQTRRAIKPQPVVSDRNPPIDGTPGDVFIAPDFFPEADVRGGVFAVCTSLGIYRCMGSQEFAAKHCPYGVPGDRLWVREAVRCFEWMDGGETSVEYVASPGVFHPDAEWVWKRESLPGMFMPRGLSRVTLTITDVRVQRLQDISTRDCWAEGIPSSPDVDPVHEFQELWCDINGASSWDANPWVWAITFNRAEA